MKYLDKLDMLSMQIMLKKNNSYKYSTIFGLMTSFAIYFILILLTIYYLNKIFNKQLQSVIFTNEFVNIAPTFNFTNYIPYAFRLEYQNFSSYSNLSMLELRARYRIRRNQIVTGFSLNLTLCNSSKFPSSYQKYFQLYNLDTAYCLDFDINPLLNKFLIQNGSYEEESMFSLRIDVSLCSNKSIKCETNRSYLEEFLFKQNLLFSFFSFEENLVQDNYHFPSEIITKKKITTVNLNSRKNFRSWLTHTNVSSNIGLITDYINSTILLSNDIQLENINVFNTITSPFLIYIDVYSNKNVIIIGRNYLKLQNAISIIIPALNTIILVFQIFLSPFTEKRFTEDIICETLCSKT